MHTTTVRFDGETWTRVKRKCEELNIAVADYIRIATVQRLERGDLPGRTSDLEARVLVLERIVEWLQRVVKRWLMRAYVRDARRRDSTGA